jgi:DNA-binding NarL/FixJ family response regulator
VLPDLAGKEVYRHITEARPNLKVIVCSGYAIDGPAQEILNAGAQGFIQKPFSYAALSEKLREVLQGR